MHTAFPKETASAAPISVASRQKVFEGVQRKLFEKSFLWRACGGQTNEQVRRRNVGVGVDGAFFASFSFGRATLHQAGGYELPQSDNRRHLRYGVPRNVRTKHRRGHSICPRCMNFILSTCGALLSLPCVRGGAARSAAEGLFLTETIFLFCSAISKLLQSLRRSRASSLYTREPFLVCANIAGTYLAHRPGKI